MACTPLAGVDKRDGYKAMWEAQNCTPTVSPFSFCRVTLGFFSFSWMSDKWPPKLFRGLPFRVSDSNRGTGPLLTACFNRPPIAHDKAYQ